MGKLPRSSSSSESYPKEEGTVKQEATTPEDDSKKSKNKKNASNSSEALPEGSMHSQSLNLSMHSNASYLNNSSQHSWIPLGVDFSSSMEVYVFEKE